MKIGMIAACPFPAYHGTPGGIREKSESLVELGHEVHVITYASCQEGDVRGVTIHRIPAIGPVDDIKVGPSVAKILWNLLLLVKTVRVVLKHDIDILHGVNYEGALIGAVTKWLTRRPLVYGAVNTMSDELPTYNFIRPALLARWLASVLDWCVPRLADRVVCYTRTIHDFQLDMGVPSERVEIINLGINLSMFVDARPGTARQQMNLNGDPLIVYAGVLNRFQRIDYLFQAMRVVLQEVPDAKLAFVRTLDDEAQRQEVELQAHEEGVADAVLFPDVIPFSELPAYLAAADAGAIPRPDCPGVPVKLINLLAAGKPVVVTRGSSQGLRDGVEALITEDHDPAAMGKALVRVLTDKELASQLARQGQEFARAEYDRLEASKRIVDAYRRTLGAGKRKSRRRRNLAESTERAESLRSEAA